MYSNVLMAIVSIEFDAHNIDPLIFNRYSEFFL